MGSNNLSKNMTKLSIINTNARSLAPKLGSLVDCMVETDTKLAVVTETWFREGQDLNNLKRSVTESGSLEPL